jgi:hypothetical protein
MPHKRGKGLPCQWSAEMKTILTATLLVLSATAAAAQTTFYGPGGDYLGQATRHRNTTTFYDSRGSFVGSSVTTGGLTSFFGRDGAFQADSGQGSSSLKRWSSLGDEPAVRPFGLDRRRPPSPSRRILGKWSGAKRVAER